jgi:hypothetical protein
MTVPIRMFTKEESSAISSIAVSGDEVVISFQTNPETGYVFGTTNLTEKDFLSLDPTIQSVGRTYNEWLRNGDLVPVMNVQNIKEQVTCDFRGRKTLRELAHKA